MRSWSIVLIALLMLVSCQKPENFQVTDREYKDELIAIAKRAYDRGLFWGTGGDISVRVPGSDRFVIKASMNCLGDLDYSKLATVNLDGEVLEGPKPSHETPIHAALYKLREQVGAILHMHSPYATAWATVGEKIPAVTQQSVTLLKNTGLVTYYPVGSKQLIEAVVDCYQTPETRIVLMENHGTFVVAKDLPTLLYDAEKVENTAKIAYLCKALGTPKSLTGEVTY